MTPLTTTIEGGRRQLELDRDCPFNPAAGRIKALTMHVRKGVEFPVVALVGVGHMPAANQSEKDEARLFYVGLRGRRSGW